MYPNVCEPCKNVNKNNSRIKFIFPPPTTCRLCEPSKYAHRSALEFNKICVHILPEVYMESAPECIRMFVNNVSACLQTM